MYLATVKYFTAHILRPNMYPHIVVSGKGMNRSPKKAVEAAKLDAIKNTEIPYVPLADFIGEDICPTIVKVNRIRR